MSKLISILRAVHCRSTHHFFAIDALDRIDTPNGRRLASVLLANYPEYLNGAKAPDTKFKDFQNHVIHVSDNNWGGAPQACEAWLLRVIEDMHNSDWKAAAYSIGVLSHYFTDPLMPLHTAQHPSEAVVHRPLEWSVCKSYDWIFRRCTNQVFFPLETGPGWISKAVLAGAAIGHKHYMSLIEYYDLKKGVLDPPSGLDGRSRTILTEIFDYTLTGWARILDRIAELAVVEIPICPLTFTTVMAAVEVPAAWVVGRISDVSEQRAVKAIFDEYHATGQVVKNVPPEIKVVSSIKPVPPEQQPVPKKVAKTTPPLASIPYPPVEPQAVSAPAENAKPLADRLSIAKPVAEKADLLQPELIASLPSKEILDSYQPEATPIATPLIVEPKLESAASVSVKSTSTRGARLSLDDDIVDAPSIGPKTAARFYQIGVTTIRQFLAASAVDMATQLNVGWIDARTLLDWQDQTRLVLQVAALCGYKAQILVGIECRTVAELASCEIDSLHDAVREFCSSEAGARIIRSAAVPSREEVAKWIESAAQPSSLPRVA